MESKATFYLHTLYARLSDRQGFASTMATRRLVERIAAYKPDVIQLHNLHGYYLDYRVLFRYLKSVDTPVVWTLHDCHAFTGHCAHFDAIGCDRWLERCGKCPQRNDYPKSILFDQSARNLAEKRALCTGLPNLTIVTPSKWLAALAQRSFLGEYPIVTIHNGVDRRVFCPTQSDLRARYGIGNRRLILGVSRYWEQRKGFNDFLALSERLAEDEAIVLVGLSKKRISSLPKGIIGIERTESVQELAAWYTAADVFVNPTLEDNFPTTQIESLACGTPVVSYNAGGCAEALDETCGVVVPKGDVDGLAKGIDQAYDLQRQDCLKRAAAFDQNNRFAEYAALYRELCGEGRA
jgi:glycosyltransferase involved in cell wall biosynthesis